MMIKQQIHVPDYLAYPIIFDWKRIEFALARYPFRSLPEKNFSPIENLRYDSSQRKKLRIELREEDIKKIEAMALEQDIAFNQALRWLAQDIFDHYPKYHITKEEIGLS